MALPTIPTLRELMEAGVHFGHASGKWHPKMAPYIFGARDRLHIIDLEKTQNQLGTVLPILEDRVKSGKTIFLVGTKRQVSDTVREVGERLGISYVNERWLGGTLTNFAQMMQSIKRMKDTEELLASEEAAKILKKERVMLESELTRMHAKFGGLRTYTKKPDAVIVIDPSYEHNAVKEAREEGVEIFAVVDTNSDPSQVDHVIPANDDGPKSLRLIMNLIEETIASGQKLKATAKELEEKAAAEKAATDGQVKDVALPAEEELAAIEEKIEEEVEEQKRVSKEAKAKKMEEDQNQAKEDAITVTEDTEV